MMKRILALCLCLMMLCSRAFAVEEGFTVRHGDRNDKRICITVDDCKDTRVLRDIFELGQELDVPITFFTLGYVLLDEDRELWRMVAESDCEIGNHCYWHNSLAAQDRWGIRNLLLRNQERLDEVLGYHYPMQVMRPPYGTLYDSDTSVGYVLSAIESAGYNHAVLWDVSQTDPDKCIHDVQNGSILLFHTMVADYRCLQQLLPQLKEQGYEFVTVSEMLGLSAVATSTDLYVRDYVK
ncbi:MAG: hypothetical protein E7316_03690 [Clostridiales bacterium]|nr:hypothetical protein [Clostridiales bacterium]